MTISAREFGDFLKTDLLDDIFPVQSDEVSVICPACGERTGWMSQFRLMQVNYPVTDLEIRYRLVFDCSHCEKPCALVGANKPKWRFA